MARTLPALDRLLAGGRHLRLLVAGDVPDALSVPDRQALKVRVVTAPQNGAVVADMTRLPFAEALFDRALVASRLADPRAELRELWRVLAPAGLAVLLLPARTGWPWARRGWDRGRLEPRLEDCMFEILDWQVARLGAKTCVVLIGKRDGLRPAMVGQVESTGQPAAASLQRESTNTACSARRLASEDERG
jgi:SAM-dependent methyltransferase